MSDKDQIKELFSQKLGGYEAKVNPELWTNISSQIGTTAAASSAAGGMSLLTKAIIGISAASVITTGAILYYNSGDTPPEKEPQNTEVRRDSGTKVEKEQSNTVVQPVADSGTEPSSTTSPVELPKTHTQDGSSDEVPTTGPNDGHASPNYYLAHKEEIDAQIARELKAREEQLRKEEERKAAEEAKEKEMLVKEAEEKLHVEDAVEPKENKEMATPEKIELQLPNGFTPNGDNSNDELYINLPDNTTFFEITILNSNSELVYTSKDPNFKWGGQDMRTNEMVPKGNYVYFVIVRTADGQELKEGQNLTIY